MHFASLSDPGTCATCCVQGDLVLRDGALITDNDVHMKAEGIYVPASGGLNMNLEPLLPVIVDFNTSVQVAKATQGYG